MSSSSPSSTLPSRPLISSLEVGGVSMPIGTVFESKDAIEIESDDSASERNSNDVRSSSSCKAESKGNENETQPLKDICKNDISTTDFRDILSFRYCNHSLRVAASSIAAMAGLNPYTSLPHLLFKLVYQSSLGHALLRNDVNLLGLSLRSDEEKMLDIATISGDEVLKRGLNHALAVQRGEVVISTVSDAEKLKKDILAPINRSDSSLVLSSAEKKILSEGVKRAIDTGFGTSHEASALDVYERRIGSTVRERNESIMEWSFVRSEHYDNYVDMHAAAQGDDATEGVVTRTTTGRSSKNKFFSVMPLTAVAIQNKRRRRSSILNDKITTGDRVAATGTSTGKWTAKEVVTDWDDGADASSPNEMYGRHSSAHAIQCDDEKSKCQVGLFSRREATEDESDDRSQSDNAAGCYNTFALTETDTKKANEHQLQRPERRRRMNCKTLFPRPFFIMQGSIDGIRDELWWDPTKASDDGKSRRAISPRESTGDASLETGNSMDENDGWILRPVIVECKHRMRKQRAQQIKATNSSSVSTYASKVKPSTSQPPPLYDQVQAVAYCLMRGIDRAEIVQVIREEQEEDLLSVWHDSRKTNTKKMDISVSRVDLTNDPVFRHLENWHDLVLPRVRSFVDAVYSIRADDDKRYQLLFSLSNGDDDEQEERKAWEILIEECPWLLHCDIAFHSLRSKPIASKGGPGHVLDLDQSRKVHDP